MVESPASALGLWLYLSGTSGSVRDGQFIVVTCGGKKKIGLKKLELLLKERKRRRMTSCYPRCRGLQVLLSREMCGCRGDLGRAR